MRRPLHNYAFIDSQNLYLGVKSLGWRVDMRRFRIYLAERYGVDKAYLFMGYVEANQGMYDKFQRYGYVIVFKPTLFRVDGSTKGNCDAELVLQAMIDYPRYEEAVIVSGDGDFYCLAEHLRQEGKLRAVLVPNSARYSALLNRLSDPSANRLAFLDQERKRLEMKDPNEKGSGRDGTPQEPFSS